MVQLIKQIEKKREDGTTLTAAITIGTSSITDSAPINATIVSDASQNNVKKEVKVMVWVLVMVVIVIITIMD